MKQQLQEIVRALDSSAQIQYAEYALRLIEEYNVLSLEEALKNIETETGPVEWANVWAAYANFSFREGHIIDAIEMASRVSLQIECDDSKFWSDVLAYGSELRDKEEE